MGAFADYCIVGVFVPSFILQTVGFFTPNWIVGSDGTTNGLFYHCHAKNNSDVTTCMLYMSDDQYFNKDEVGLHASAVVMTFLSCVSVACIINFLRDDNSSTSLVLAIFRLLGCAMVFFYPIAGILISVGCILIVADHINESIGYSFYLCIGAASYIIVKCIVIVVCCFYCKSSEEVEDEIQSRSGSQSNVSKCSFSNENDNEKSIDAASEQRENSDRVKTGLSAVVAAARMKQLMRFNK